MANKSNVFDRDFMRQQLGNHHFWDIIVIGGGATGLGIAVDAANRGYNTLLFEQEDFAKGTSSRSTKLVHGGVRYLAQGDIKLVIDALRERGLLMKNASHLAKRQAFIIPCYNLLEKWKYLIGLKLYDWLSGKYSIGASSFLDRKQILTHLPDIKEKGIQGGVQYYDGQFDDARLAINLAQTAAENGAVLLNYYRVTALHKTDGKIDGVTALDRETGDKVTIKAKVVINATGVFADDILQMDIEEHRPMIRPSQGVHLVFDKDFLEGKDALMIPKTADGRVLFAVPWHEHILVGTTDTPLNTAFIEPIALDEEVKFILATVKKYFKKEPERKDVLSVFAGLRPLAAPQKDTNSTKEISRDHKLMVSPAGLVTITGGKWTTYRKMAEEAVNKAIATGGLSFIESNTKHLKIHGNNNGSASETHLSVYGSDEINIEHFIHQNPIYKTPLTDGLPYIEAEVVWAVRHEMARTVEDVLARRLRILFLDAKAAIKAAPRVAELMAKELGRSEEWKTNQLRQFTILAKGYLLSDN
ncbi:MAG: FAD-dependent oxidoreductase [Ilyomonas sp.]